MAEFALLLALAASRPQILFEQLGFVGAGRSHISARELGRCDPRVGLPSGVRVQRFPLTITATGERIPWAVVAWTP